MEKIIYIYIFDGTGEQTKRGEKCRKEERVQS